MKKRVIIVHCWGGEPDSRWYPYVKRELEPKGFEVVIPNFGQDDPLMGEWVPKLREAVGTPDENLILVGHSVGCITILRYLETLEPGQKIKAAILVAGYTDNLGFDELSNFYEAPIDYEKIKTHCDTFIAINSDNDPYVPLEHSGNLHRLLNAEAIVMHNMGHFSEPDGGGDAVVVKELPIIVEKILSITNK